MTIRKILLLFFGALVVELIALALVLALVINGQQELAQTENLRYRAFKIADELRQSSDDLTRMARTYVSTGDPVFERYFQEIIQIRDGKKARPANYDRIYWDLVAAGKKVPGNPKPPISLNAQLETLHLTDEELMHLQNAKDNSDALVSLETEAMNAVKGLFNKDGQSVQDAPDPYLARSLMFGEKYHTAKAAIMKPIDDFLESLENRMNAAVSSQRESLKQQELLAAFLVALTLVSFGILAMVIRRRVVGPVNMLVEQSEAIRKGDYGKQVEFSSGDEIGALAGTFNRMSTAISDDITQRINSESELRKAKELAEATLAELKITQTQLVQSEKMASLGQLTAGIAHEIKNPLNFVTNFSETSAELVEELKDEFKTVRDRLNDDTKENVDELVTMLAADLEKINEHGRRADGIVKSMLLHARGGSSEPSEIALNPLISEALNLAYHGERARDKSFEVTLEEEFDAAAGVAKIVPQELMRVLVNLIGNAFYAVKKQSRETDRKGYKPTVSVATADRGDRVEIRVRDNGTGIPKEVRDKLFEPFFTTKPPGEGTGLGLSMCFDIISHQHGGQVSVDSKPGEYTEFKILLPRHAGDGIVAKQKSKDGVT